MTSLMYRNTFFYTIAMRLIYGKGFYDRYEKITALIPKYSSVVEVCCGDCYLYKHYLLHKNIAYTGLDINPLFIDSARGAGIHVLRRNLLSNESIPEADYILIQASLYHFILDVDFIYDNLLEAAKTELIIAEPIHNLSTSSNALIRCVAKYSANPGTGNPRHRFTKHTFEKFCHRHAKDLKGMFEIANGREACAIFQKPANQK